MTIPAFSTDLKYRYPARYRASWGALALLVVVASFLASSVLTGRSLQLVSALAGILALAALGQMLIIMLGAIDLSVPATIAAAAGVTVHYADSGTLGVVVGALAVAVAISLINGVLISGLHLNSVIVTLATYAIVSGAIQVWTGVAFSNSGQAPAALQDFAGRAVLSLNMCFLMAIAIGALLVVVLTHTRAGRRVARVGDNARAARAQGINLRAVELSTFAGAGLLYGLAGVLIAAFIATPDISVGSPYQLASITVVAIAGASFSGGPASISSVLCASVFLTMLDQTLTVQGLSAGARVIAQGVALVVAIAVITVGQYATASAWRLLRHVRGSRALPAGEHAFAQVVHSSSDDEAGREAPL